MKYNDHINELIAQYKVRRLDKAEAMIINILAGSDLMRVLYASSFSGDRKGDKVIYLAEDEADANGTYYIGLHEMGHIACGHFEHPAKDKFEEVEHEIEAWKWALSHAKRPPTDSTYCLIIDAISTYTDVLEMQTRGRDFEEPDYISPEDIAWSRQLFSGLNVGAKWGVPRSGLLLRKVDETTFALDDVMPWTESMGEAARQGKSVPPTPEKLREFQKQDWGVISRRFEAAGITMTDPKGLLR